VSTKLGGQVGKGASPMSG